MSDTPKTDKAEKLALELTKELTWDCVVAGEAGIRQIARACRKFERENAELRSLLREAITDHVSPYDLPESEDYIARVKTALGEDKP